VRDAIEVIAAQWWSSGASSMPCCTTATRTIAARARARRRTRGPDRQRPRVRARRARGALERLLIERVVSVNTAAAGGNATLMTVG
jgi:delta 1-pyrroline-5-carboxylate dehydrogenase